MKPMETGQSSKQHTEADVSTVIVHTTMKQQAPVESRRRNTTKPFARHWHGLPGCARSAPCLLPTHLMLLLVAM